MPVGAVCGSFVLIMRQSLVHTCRQTASVRARTKARAFCAPQPQWWR